MPAATEAIVGREQELAALEAVVGRGDGGVVIVGGAGIGKTTVWSHAVRVADDFGFRVLRARPAGAESGLPFGVLGDLFADVAEDVLDELPPPQRHALRAALLLDAPAAETALENRAVAVATAAALRRLARERALAVAVDDLHWTDPPSAAVLAFALRRLSGEAVVAVLATRAGELAHEHVLTAIPNLRRVELGPLTIGATQRLIRLRLGESLDRSRLRRVHAASAGNPFFALELAAALNAGETVASSLERLLEKRLEALPRATRDALATLAFEPRHHLRDEDVAPALEAGVIEDVGARLRFTHPLLEEAAAELLDPAERRRLQRGLADETDDPIARARLLGLAAEAPDERVAVALDGAAQALAARGATDSAIEYAALAVDLTPAEQAPQRRERLRTLVSLQMLIGDPAARASAAELVAGAAPGVERAELYRILAHTRDDDYVEALCYVEEALKEAPHEHPVRVGVLRSHATMLLVNGDVAGARGSAQVALDLAERLTCQVPETRAHALLLDVFAGTPVDVGALRADTPSSASTPESQQLHVTLGQCLLYRGLFADAREILGTAERTSFHLGVDAMRAMALFYLVELECHAACYAEADRLANEGLDVIAQLDWPQWESALLAAKALVDAYLGRIADARRRVAEGIELSGRVGDQLFGVKNDRVLGFVELSNGNVRAAADILGRAADRVREMGFGNPVVFAVLPDAIHALLAAGEIPRARCFLQELEDAGRRLDAPWSLAQAARYRGVLAAGEGRLADAEAAFAEAFRQHERVDAPFEKGRTLLARGEVLRRAKRKRAARESLEAAAATFTALGTPLWAAHAAAALQRVGGRPAATDALTASERRVAELVALGRSNKEVAAELFVTVRTVEAHLSKVYAKLGLRSRAELARRMQL